MSVEHDAAVMMAKAEVGVTLITPLHAAVLCEKHGVSPAYRPMSTFPTRVSSIEVCRYIVRAEARRNAAKEQAK